MVLLLVIAAQQGLIGPRLRLGIGALLGVALLAGGMVTYQKWGQHVLGVTVTCTGLAAEYLVTIAAVRGVGLLPVVPGHVLSGLIVVLSVTISVAWHQQWLAACSFAASGLLAPVVGGGLTANTIIFEALLVAGAAAAMVLGMGFASWIGASCPAAIVAFAALVNGAVDTPGLWALISMVAVAWAALIVRWLLGLAAADPGPFQLRQPSTDPAQIQRDYADFAEHTRQQQRARSERAVVVGTLSVSASLLVLALASVEPHGLNDLQMGITAAIAAAVFSALALAGGRHPALAATPLNVSAWVVAVGLLAVALLRVLDGDAVGVAWLVLGTVVLGIVAAERARSLLVPALAFGIITAMAAAPALNPADLLQWPGIGIIDLDGLLARAWRTVLPAGVCLIVLCVAAWWAVHRCVPTSSSIDGSHRRSVVIAWTIVSGSAVACYGMLAVIMVLVYAISPTRTGFQIGQISVTALLVATGLILIWQGFRSLTVRLGGLGLAAVAVAKLLLVDTGTLAPMVRAVTVLAVGVLLLFGAGVFLRATGRAARVRVDPATGPRSEPPHVTP